MENGYLGFNIREGEGGSKNIVTLDHQTTTFTIGK